MLKRSKTFLTLCCLLAVLTGCRCSSGQRHATHGAGSCSDTLAEQVIPHYAKGFQLRYANGGRLAYLDIFDPQHQSKETYHFLLYRGEKPSAKEAGDYLPLQIPLRNVVCMTSLQLSNFIALDATDKVVGITSTRHLFNAKINDQIRSGHTKRIGIEGNFDNEVIMSIHPSVILISPFKRGGYDALKEVYIPLVPHLGYKEMTPLGQAEWMKLMGLLIGKEREANHLFAEIEQTYLDLKRKAADAKRRPVVFSGEMRGGIWYAVGGESFLARLFHDAGADYFLKDDTHSGGLTLDFETIYSRAAHADYWRILNSYKGRFDYDALRAEDSRYADFDAFRKHRVIYCNMSETPFYEAMPVEPHVILKDLIHIFHPDLLPDHQPVYYRLLP